MILKYDWMEYGIRLFTTYGERETFYWIQSHELGQPSWAPVYIPGNDTDSIVTLCSFGA
jgi:hypothetical protein